MFEQVAQKRMETMSETNVVHFWGDTRYIFMSLVLTVSQLIFVLLLTIHDRLGLNGVSQLTR